MTTKPDGWMQLGDADGVRKALAAGERYQKMRRALQAVLDHWDCFPDDCNDCEWSQEKDCRQVLMDARAALEER